MKLFRKQLLICVLSVGVSALSMMQQAVAADGDTLNLLDLPVFLTSSVDPNLIVTFDDSGSMNWGFMPSDILNNSGTQRAKSNTFNTVYYDPTVNYEPPPRADGTAYPTASYNSARLDGYNTGSATLNLQTSYRVSWCEGLVDADFCPVGIAARPADVGAYNGAYYYAFDGTVGGENNDANYTLVQVNPLSATERTNFANWYQYYRTRSLLARTAAHRAFYTMEDRIRIAWQTLNRDRDIDVIQPYGSQKSDFFDWLATMPRSGGTPLRESMKRAGEYFRTSGADGPYAKNPDGGDAGDDAEFSCRQNFNITLTDGIWNGDDPTDITTRDDASITLPDGTGYDPATNGRLYADGRSLSLADVAFNYWANDLRGDLDDTVPTFISNSTGGVTGADPYWNPVNNPATWQHVVNFVVGLGLNGSLTFPTDLAALANNTLEWDHSGSRGRVDDLWHAAVNSRGEFFTAQDPSRLVAAFGNILNSIVSRSNRGSASGVSVSSGLIGPNSQLFRTIFDTQNWTGTLRAIPFSALGSADVIADWDAACILDGDRFVDATVPPTPSICEATGDPRGSGRDPDSRVIYTVNALGDLVNFEFANLSPSQQAELNTNPQDMSDDGRGVDRVRFLRGHTTASNGTALEQADGGSFRNRSSMLGDIIHSGATIVADPNENYPVEFPIPTTTPYADFINANLNRAPTLYVGANDGMLHAFDGNGNELWAFIPSMVVENLNELTSPQYRHRAYVDSQPTVRDVFIGGVWRTVLVGGLRTGGQGIYALDVTDSLNPVFLWEFTDEDNANMGFVYDAPFITRLQDGNGTWVAILGNGYNAAQADANVGTTESGMFVIQIDTKAHSYTPTGVGGNGSIPNGMSALVPIDVERDGDAEYAYGGDLMGNVWRFDNLSPSSSATFYKLYDTASEGGVSPGDKPVIARPEAIFDAFSSDVLVLVGSGRYITQDDLLQTDVRHSFYGLRDSGSSITDGLLQQTIISESGNSREVSNNTIADTFGGWQLDLTNESGERQSSSAFVRGGNVFFTTTIPESTDPCNPGGVTWLMAVNAFDGGAIDEQTPFDFNGDGIIDASDGESEGIQLENTTGFVAFGVTRGARDQIFFDSTDGTGITSLTIDTIAEGRRSWRQFIRQ